MHRSHGGRLAGRHLPDQRGLEVLVEGENGYIIEDPLNPAEIAAKIQQGFVITGTSIAETNSGILNRLTWGNHIKQVLELYETVINLKHGENKR